MNSFRNCCSRFCTVGINIVFLRCFPSTSLGIRCGLSDGLGLFSSTPSHDPDQVIGVSLLRQPCFCWHLKSKCKKREHITIQATRPINGPGTPLRGARALNVM